MTRIRIRMNNNIIYLAPFKKIISFSIQNFRRKIKYILYILSINIIYGTIKIFYKYNFTFFELGI